MPSYFVFIPLLTLLAVADARIVEEPLTDNDCSPQMNMPLMEVAEKICELCHEFHSHEVPNMRAECRSECFSTDKFRMCMRMFTSAPKRHNRHSRRHIFTI
ncbi:unnamed protein product [Cylicocyclus nassatus]|uniref:Uncharacterized protein n=1 Tax=Cylicocyclus nassatus TaxID=53992 RepID=A0AA36H4S1_CYLNA|nr:unnamed protein product [Cylicocyclus nassatus]CAJ0604029.1 unnamed protein product [Cylicocyclus nassatus]